MMFLWRSLSNRASCGGSLKRPDPPNWLLRNRSDRVEYYCTIPWLFFPQSSASRASSTATIKHPLLRRPSFPSIYLAMSSNNLIMDERDEYHRSPLLPSFPYWNKPTRCTSITSSLIDLWLIWGTYLGLGIGLQNFVIGGLAAGLVAILGLLFQVYR